MKQPTKPFALCVGNSRYQASLIPGKVYHLLPDARAAKDDMVRLVDESGEDYLFAADRFVAIEVPAAVRASLLKAARA